ncbi:hypothetical protein M9458_038361, partial [Cirrhinus mrigala]
LEIEDFTLNVAPTSGRVSSPTILRLHPIVRKPTLLHANLPLRFGRDSQMTPRERASKTNINLPQRFGREWTLSDSPTKIWEKEHVRFRPFPCIGSLYTHT